MSSAAVFISRSLKHSVRNLESLMISLALPILLLLVFVLIFGGAIQSDGDYIDYVVPGIIILCAGYGASLTATSVNGDLATGIIDRFRTMPISSATVLLGPVVASVARNLVSTTLVLLVAVGLGFRPTAGGFDWLLLFGVITLYIVAMTWLAVLVGIVAKSVDAAGAFGFVVLFLPYLSSAFVPVDTLPGWLQPVAEHQPITPLIETMRALLLGGNAGWSGLAAVLWCSAILVMSVIVASWRFRHRQAR